MPRAKDLQPPFFLVMCNEHWLCSSARLMYPGTRAKSMEPSAVGECGENDGGSPGVGGRPGRTSGGASNTGAYPRNMGWGRSGSPPGSTLDCCPKGIPHVLLHVRRKTLTKNLASLDKPEGVVWGVNPTPSATHHTASGIPVQSSPRPAHWAGTQSCSLAS